VKSSSRDPSHTATAVSSGQSHTPGPWHVQPHFRSIYALSAGDSGLTTFIAKAGGHQCGETQADANARLIAAAPELLKALKDAPVLLLDRAALRALGPEARAYAEQLVAWGPRAQDAIAAAEGRS
jgi:hypothetical protein